MVVEGVGEVLRLHGHPRIRPADAYATRRMRVGLGCRWAVSLQPAGRATTTEAVAGSPTRGVARVYIFVFFPNPAVCRKRNFGRNFAEFR